MILQVSSIEGSLIDPDESSSILDESFEVALVDMSILNNIFSHRLNHSQLWLSKLVLQVFFENFGDNVSTHFRRMLIHLSDLVDDHLDGLHLSLKLLKSFSDRLNSGLME